MAEQKITDVEDDYVTETLLRNRKRAEMVSLQNGQKQEDDIEGQYYNPEMPLKLKVLRRTVFVFIKMVNVFYIPLFVLRKFQKSKKCTGVTDNLLKIPATELTKKIRRREVSCEDVIRSYIRRIEEVNPLLNAVVESRFAEALEDARKVDKLVSSEEYLNNEEKLAEEYPLLGVPLTVKGSIAVKGLLYTSGTATRKNLRAEEDAVVVALSRKAGAIPLLVSNVPELCMDWKTSNKVIGTTRNPHDITWSPGGSSGGEASLMGAGASLVGLGSDIAGSLRLPPHLCGTYGHKPTPGVVSFEGHFPSCRDPDIWRDVFTLGPMARYAGDLRVLLSVIAKPEERETLKLDKKIDIKDVKVYFNGMEEFYWDKTRRHCLEVVDKVVGHFKNVCDSPPKRVDIPLFEYCADLSAMKLLCVQGIDFIKDEKSSLVPEVLRYLIGRSKHCFMTLTYGFFHELFTLVLSKKTEKIDKLLSKLLENFELTLGQNGVFILPLMPVDALKKGDEFRYSVSSGFMSIFNALGLPVTSCPVMFSSRGLPMGVQVVGLRNCDSLTLTVAEEIEKAFGGWKEP